MVTVVAALLTLLSYIAKCHLFYLASGRSLLGLHSYSPTPASVDNLISFITDIHVIIIMIIIITTIIISNVICYVI